MATSMIEDSAQADNRAKVRIGVAIALIITAIAILALLSHRKSDAPAQAATEAPSTQATSNAEPESVKETTPAEPAGKAETDSADSHQISSPPPVSGDEPAKTETPIADKTKSDTTPSNVPPPPVVGQLPPLPTTTTPPNPIAKRTGSNDLSQKAPLSPAQVIATPPATSQVTPAPVVATPTKPAAASLTTAPTPKAFEVQLGVFSDPENAKQLQAKLAAAGIPAHLETRLQVGPFQNRAEADAARDKIKALGINSVIVGKQ